MWCVNITKSDRVMPESKTVRGVGGKKNEEQLNRMAWGMEQTHGSRKTSLGVKKKYRCSVKNKTGIVDCGVGAREKIMTKKSSKEPGAVR